jgi:hypothetical protein
MLNHWLNVLFLLLSAVLLLNVFRRAAAEVVCPVFFRDNVPTPASGITDRGGESPDFCLHVRPLNSVCPGLQLLSLLLKRGNIWITRKRGQDVIRDVNQGAGIAHKTHVRQHTKDAVCRETLKDGGLDIKPHLLINIRSIIYGRVRVVSYDLVLNGIGGST